MFVCQSVKCQIIYIGSRPHLTLSCNHAPIYTNSSWIETSQTNLYDEKANSQALLINVLHNEAHELDGSDRADLLDPIPEPMVNGLQGTVIKQDRKYTKVVEQSDLPAIMPVVQGIADSVCYRFYPQCEVVDS